MTTLILSPRHTEDSQKLWRAALELGWEVVRVQGWRVEDLPPISEPVVYAETMLAMRLSERLGIQLDEPPVDWLPTLPDEYRGRAVKLSTLGAELTRTEPAFIKPPNDKSFAARVYLGSDLPADFDPDMPVLVQEVVHFLSEFRCFVLDRRVAARSHYSGEHDDEGLEGFVQTLLADPRVALPKATVVDVGRIENRGWAVIEQNAAWGAGIYECDALDVLPVLRAASGLPGG